MGIRFACPNGHPLHVKADLAGKRGICPECQVRFIIPTPESTQARLTESSVAARTPAVQAPENNASQPVTQSTAAPQTAVAPVAPSAPDPPPNPPAPTPQPSQQTPAETPLWYVRPASGGQFGPADDALVRQWAAEGRVAADAFVWRTGWSDWKRASDVAEYFPNLAQQTVDQSPHIQPTEYNSGSVQPGGSSAPTSDVSQATARYQRRKQAAARGQMLVAIALVVLALVLAGVLVWVINRTSNGVSSPAGAPVEAPVEPANIDPELPNNEPVDTDE